jgi:hypothetical protein
LDSAGDDTKNHKPVGDCEGKRKEKEKGGEAGERKTSSRLILKDVRDREKYSTGGPRQKSGVVWTAGEGVWKKGEL